MKNDVLALTIFVQGRIIDTVLLINLNKEDIRMNKTELIDAMAVKCELSKKDTEKALKALTDTVSEALAEGDKVALVGFGTFDVIEKAAREGRNPSTGKKIKIAACKAPKFKAGKALKDAVNK